MTNLIALFCICSSVFLNNYNNVYNKCILDTENKHEIVLTENQKVEKPKLCQVSDLTNTSWIFNSTLSTNVGSYSFTGVAYGNPNPNEGISVAGCYSWSASRFTFDDLNGDGIFYYDNSRSSWTCGSLVTDVTLNITGGTDVTNSSLIAYLEANATLVGGDTPSVEILFNNVTIHNNYDNSDTYLNIPATADFSTFGDYISYLDDYNQETNILVADSNRLYDRRGAYLYTNSGLTTNALSSTSVVDGLTLYCNIDLSVTFNEVKLHNNATNDDFYLNIPVDYTTFSLYMADVSHSNLSTADNNRLYFVNYGYLFTDDLLTTHAFNNTTIVDGMTLYFYKALIEPYTHVYLTFIMGDHLGMIDLFIPGEFVTYGGYITGSGSTCAFAKDSNGYVSSRLFDSSSKLRYSGTENYVLDTDSIVGDSILVVEGVTAMLTNDFNDYIDEQRGFAFDSGYSQAMDDDFVVANMFQGFATVALVPVNVFLKILNFEIFGINIAGLVTGLLTISLIVIVIRFIFGAKEK